MAEWLTFLGGLAGLACVGWAVWRWYVGSENRPALIVRWILTLLDLAFIAFVAGPLVGQGGFAGAFGGVPMTAFAGLIMAIIWVPSITGALGSRVGSLYDGGRTPADREPLISMVQARRKQGRHPEAARLMREQLLEYPTHFQGQMLLAEILADDLHRLDEAEGVIEGILSQEGHPPSNVAFALTRMADWHLKHAQDVEAARSCFQRTVDLLPDSTESHLAHQRMARLSGTEEVLRSKGTKRLEAPQADPHLGVRRGPAPPVRLPDPGPAVRVAALVRQLEAAPHDNQTREELANLYAGEYGRPDLALNQLEQLVAQPHAPVRHVFRWLNRMADIALDLPNGEAQARQVLETLIVSQPESPAAAAARRRLAILHYEARKKQAGPTVRLGPSPKTASSPAERPQPPGPKPPRPEPPAGQRTD